ncbi:hypothetical protein BWO91_14660 [Plantibacter flavus]|uniref:Ig-like domain-containing protein n=1 Tax=Plantibacter flavus TaxID=150123 RepID=UPI00099C90B2|nr:Ig-like domain-containing protein [Plantibacter flavus]AQX81047.1 hypothetical protein BWO91_14660 [Plantibacter flavus]
MVVGSVVVAASISVFGIALTAAPPAQAAPVAAPQIVKFHANNSKMDSAIDELRASFVLKVPHGYVNATTGAMQRVDGKYLRVGYDYDGRNDNGVPSYRSMQYINTFSASGATVWASNRGEFFTVHKVIAAGENDYLVISVEGDMDVPPSAGNNVPGGHSGQMNLYFSLANSAVASTIDTSWIPGAQTVFPVDLRIYADGWGVASRSGPVVQVQYDATYNLWSGNQANWGQVIDYGLNGQPAGVLPPNSLPVDLTNFAFTSVATGPAGSVSDSFWYAWVHEDGSLVTSINTAPIHVTGVTPHRDLVSNSAVVKNVPPAASGGPTLAWTAGAAAQGLTNNVKADGRVDFRSAGGTGYYRLVVWPESRNPATVTANNGSPLLSYTAGQLFAGERPVAGRIDESWTVGSVYYNYSVARPDAPTITTPSEGGYLQSGKSVTISGTGTPGHSISLKLASGSTISNINAATNTTLADGDQQCGPTTACSVIVDTSGAWSYTYAPQVPLVDGTYTVLALQTEQTSGYYLTSAPSNPDPPTSATNWGVTFSIDTTVPAAPAFQCLATPSKDATPTLSGSGLEVGGVARIYEGQTLLGTATVTGSTWSYTVVSELPDGIYGFAATQVDRAGNESPRTAACKYQVATDVVVVGVTKVADIVVGGDPTLPSVSASNWEVTAASATATELISGATGAELERGVTYTISERFRSTPGPDANASLYTQRGELACVDGDARPLDSSVFDASTRRLVIGATTLVAEPITCAFTNQTSHLSFVTKQLNGPTNDPTDGWSVSADATGGTSVSLDASLVRTEARPGTYSAAAAVPEGLSLLGIQMLRRDAANCAAFAGQAADAPESCWTDLNPSSVIIEQGERTVLRVVAASPQDLPGLPMTGGVGAWLFTTAGGLVVVLAMALWVLSRLRGSVLAARARV